MKNYIKLEEVKYFINTAINRSELALNLLHKKYFDHNDISL